MGTGTGIPGLARRVVDAERTDYNGCFARKFLQLMGCDIIWHNDLICLQRGYALMILH